MSSYVSCWACNGNGLVQVIRKNGPWGTATCPDCKGTGKDDEKTRVMELRKEIKSNMCERRNKRLDRIEENTNEHS